MQNQTRNPNAYRQPDHPRNNQQAYSHQIDVQSPMNYQQNGLNYQPIPPQKPSMSAIAIVALVFAILALVTALIPIVNNAAFFGALVAVVCGIVGIVTTKGGKKRGRGMAIASVVLAVVSIVAVLVSQSIYGAALDSASQSLKGETTSLSASSTSSTSTNTKSSSNGGTAAAETVTLYDSNGITVVANGKGSDFMSAFYTLEITNNSGQDIIVQARDVSCNGTMTTASMSETVTAGKRADAKLYLYDVKEAGALANTEGTLCIINPSTYQTIDSATFAIA